MLSNLFARVVVEEVSSVVEHGFEGDCRVGSDSCIRSRSDHVIESDSVIGCLPKSNALEAVILNKETADLEASLEITYFSKVGSVLHHVSETKSPWEATERNFGLFEIGFHD